MIRAGLTIVLVCGFLAAYCAYGSVAAVTAPEPKIQVASWNRASGSFAIAAVVGVVVMLLGVVWW